MNKDLLELLKDNFIYIVAVFVLAFAGIYFVANKAITPFKTNNEVLKTKKETYENLQRELAILKEQQEKMAQEEKDAEENKKKEQELISKEDDKPFFKTFIKSVDSFSSNAPLFEDIIKILKANRLKLISIENKTTGFDDPIVQNAGATYNTCMVDMQILGTYSNFQKFLSYLYEYPYLIKIASINVIPYDKEKTTLIIKLSLVLYSETVSE